MKPPICTIIAAFDAEASIAAAVRSALADAMVAEVVVVDDASRDGTAAAAQAADDGTGRLTIIRFDANRGPSAARNAAIAASRSPLLAILDADDHFTPGRFTPLMPGGAWADDDWDMIADNIAFVREGAPADGVPDAARQNSDRMRPLDFTEFVRRNISVRGKPRAELGFLKPVMRRSCLDALGLRYDDNLRLGEDFILYATAIGRGARFRLAERCGYVAIERAGSLSGRHRTSDLAALCNADAAIAAIPTLSTGERATITAHRQALAGKVAHRRFLDDKRDLGLGAAIRPLLRKPSALIGVARDIARDKRESGAVPPAQPPVRYLFAPSEFGGNG